MFIPGSLFPPMPEEVIYELSRPDDELETLYDECYPIDEDDLREYLIPNQT